MATLGSDAAQTKYSTLDEITPANVQRLELAWTWQTVDRAGPPRGPAHAVKCSEGHLDAGLE